LAAGLEATGARRREDLMRIATWRLDGGSPISVDLLAAAAEQAWAARDVTLAERLRRAAVDAGGLSRAGHVFGQVLLHGRAPDRAEATLADVMSGPLSALDLSRLGATRSMNLHFGLGDADAAAAVLDAVGVPGLTDDLRDWLAVVRTLEEAQHRPAAEVLENTYRPVAPHLSVHMRRPGRCASCTRAGSAKAWRRSRATRPRSRRRTKNRRSRTTARCACGASHWRSAAASPRRKASR
jgi:hypothetical protein